VDHALELRALNSSDRSIRQDLPLAPPRRSASKSPRCGFPFDGPRFSRFNIRFDAGDRSGFRPAGGADLGTRVVAAWISEYPDTIFYVVSSPLLSSPLAFGSFARIRPSCFRQVFPWRARRPPSAFRFTCSQAQWQLFPRLEARLSALVGPGNSFCAFYRPARLLFFRPGWQATFHTECWEGLPFCQNFPRIRFFCLILEREEVFFFLSTARAVLLAPGLFHTPPLVPWVFLRPAFAGSFAAWHNSFPRGQ